MAWIRRVRVSQAVLAIAALAGAAWVASTNPFTQWWFWVAATTALTIAVVEPYFTGVTSALLFSLGALAAGLTADRQGVEPLWIAYFILTGAVLIASLVAIASGAGRIQDSCRWFATRFGRPLWLGMLAVLVEVLREASKASIASAMPLAIGTLLALLIATPDWYRLVMAAQPTLGGLATLEMAVEPNVVLLTTDQRFPPGTAVNIQGTQDSGGVVIGNLAHKAGNRLRVALERPWFDIAQSSGQQCSVIAATAAPAPAAIVAEGSTDLSLSLRPFGSLSRGDTVYWEDPASGRKYLYQVMNRELARETWDGSSVVAEHATAVMLGAVEAGGMLLDAALPQPYVPVFSAASVSGALPTGYDKIGKILGTDVPFGISAEHLSGHHLAILGMSGMGKTTIARKILGLLAKNSVVIAMDGTGEYKSRFDLTSWDPSVGLSTTGSWVYEPAGVQAQRAAEFIEDVMKQANSEYVMGQPIGRTLLLEEAHSYLPEWNFVASRNESDFVARSCRFILQARKFGLSFVLVSQRTAVISKSALSQCESYIVLRTLDETSLQYIEGVLGREFRDVVSSLSRFQAVCVGPAFSAATPVVVDLDPFDPPADTNMSEPAV